MDLCDPENLHYILSECFSFAGYRGVSVYWYMQYPILSYSNWSKDRLVLSIMFLEWCLGKIPWRILSMATDLLILLEICFTCACQLSWLSIITPRNLISVFSSISLPLTVMLIDCGLFLLVNSIRCVFWRFIMSLFVLSHSKILQIPFLGYP